MSDLPSTGHRPTYPPGFRARRGLNWSFIGLLYTSFYMCRYNFSVANASISEEFHFDESQMGVIITVALLAYAFGQILNGLITDRIGGKRAMLIGASGTIVMNICFGVASLAVNARTMMILQLPLLLWMFATIRALDGFMQAYGAPGMIKINAAWFHHTERGRFAGIFGFMINLGRFGIFRLGKAVLTGFALFGAFTIAPLHWRWLFWIPAMIATIMAICMWLVVKETPEEAGFHNLHPDSREHGYVHTTAMQVLRTMAGSRVLWITALAYACTGAVRQSVDQWFPKFMKVAHGVDIGSSQLQWLALLLPVVASAGSLLSGYVSDIYFQARRAPVAAFLYFVEAGVILLATQFHSAVSAIVFLLLISFTVNSTHSILGTAAAMDIGGARMAGFASGLIDSFQYFGGSLAGYFLGSLVKQSWGYYFYFMAPFGVVGGLLMLSMIGRENRENRHRA